MTAYLSEDDGRNHCHITHFEYCLLTLPAKAHAEKLGIRGLLEPNGSKRWRLRRLQDVLELHSIMLPAVCRQLLRERLQQLAIRSLQQAKRTVRLEARRRSQHVLFEEASCSCPCSRQAREHFLTGRCICGSMNATAIWERSSRKAPVCAARLAETPPGPAIARAARTHGSRTRRPSAPR